MLFGLRGMATIASVQMGLTFGIENQAHALTQCPHQLKAIIGSNSQPLAAGQPVIIDDQKNLTRFFRKLRELSEGKISRVRVGFYGDSNYTMDWGTSELREILGSQFGYGGHGFVAGGQPWSWYQHREVDITTSGGWKSYATSTPRHESNDYGHSGILGFGSAGSSVTYQSKERGSKENQIFDQVEIHYSCRPQAGEMEIHLDGQNIKTISTQCPTSTYLIAPLSVPLGQHKVELKVTKGTVWLFGAAFERNQPGIVVDGLGVGALNLYRTATMKPELFSEGLKARQYDLVIFHTGTNMWNPKKHPEWAKDVIARIRESLGQDISVMFLSPPDFRNKDTKLSHPRMAECGKEKQEIAKNEGIAFWDYYAAMGGAGSIITWQAQDMVSPDFVHLKEGLHKIMMKHFSMALFEAGNRMWSDKDLACLGYQSAVQNQEPMPTQAN